MEICQKSTLSRVILCTVAGFIMCSLLFVYTIYGVLQNTECYWVSEKYSRIDRENFIASISRVEERLNVTQQELRLVRERLYTELDKDNTR